MRLRHTLPLALALVASSAAQLGAQTTPSSDRIVVPLSSPDKPATLQVQLVNGGITVEAYPGKEIIIVSSPEPEDEKDPETSHKAQSSGLRRLPNASLGLTVEEEQNQVRIESNSWNRANNLRVQVPVNTSLKLSCVNDGDISVRGVVGDHELQNVNGSIEITDAQGSVVASTTNGEIKVVLTRIDASKAMAFSSFNGDVDVSLPAALKANVRLRSDQGEIYSDFDVALDRNPPQVREEHSGSRYRIEVQQELRGTIGGGGPEFFFKTFNGDIYLRRK
jgi:hypothetical protein